MTLLQKSAPLEVTDDKQRDHITLKAVVTTTDQGVFKAVVSTESVDREKDIVSADGMVAALHKWNRPVPLAWNHGTQAEDIVGAVDPQTAKNINGEVVVEGQVDLESKAGPDAWRSFKNRTIGFSFGYLIVTATKRAGGGRAITELDVFEITATPTPMNNDTRVLSTKAEQALGQLEEAQKEELEELQEVKARLEKIEKALEDLSSKADETETEVAVDLLRNDAQRIALEVRSDGLSANPPVKQAVVEEPKPGPEMDPDELRTHARSLMLQVLSGDTNEQV